VFERRDVLMEENQMKAGTSAAGSGLGHQLAAEAEGYREGATEEAVDILNAEGGSGE